MDTSTTRTGTRTAPRTARDTGRRPMSATPQRGGALRAWATRAPLMPALVFLIVVTQLPFVATLVISLFDWNSWHPDNREFTGLTNYHEVLTDPAMRESVVTTALLTATVVLVALALGLGRPAPRSR